MSQSLPTLPGRPVILQVIPALDAGGAERTTLDMAAAIVAAGGRALVASRGGRKQKELDVCGAEHITLPVHSKNPLTMLANVARLRRLIRTEAVALVHARSRAPAWSALVAAGREGVPFLTTYHSQVHEGPKSKVLYNSVMVRGQAVIANSAYTAERVHRIHQVPWARIETIPRGIDTAFFDPARLDPESVAALRHSFAGEMVGDGPIFLLPARLTRWKGQLVAIEAARHLVSAGETRFRLVLVGDAQGRDAYVEELKAAIAAAGLTSNVVLHDSPADFALAYAAADIVLAPSVEPEPFGRVAVEAQAMERPVIVSDAGGQRETVTDEAADPGAGTGLKVPPGDAEALCRAMRHLMAQGQEVRRAIGARGRARALERYTVEAMCGATLQLYRRLLALSDR